MILNLEKSAFSASLRAKDFEKDGNKYIFDESAAYNIEWEFPEVQIGIDKNSGWVFYYDQEYLGNENQNFFEKLFEVINNANIKGRYTVKELNLKNVKFINVVKALIEDFSDVLPRAKTRHRKYKNLDEAFDDIIGRLSDQERERLKKSNPHVLHFTFGLWIRNNFIFNAENNILDLIVEKRKKKNKNFTEFDEVEMLLNADMTSSIIIEELIKKLKSIDSDS